MKNITKKPQVLLIICAMFLIFLVACDFEGSARVHISAVESGNSHGFSVLCENRGNSGEFKISIKNNDGYLYTTTSMYIDSGVTQTIGIAPDFISTTGLIFEAYSKVGDEWILTDIYNY